MLFVVGMEVVVGKAVVAASSPYPILPVLSSGLRLERMASMLCTGGSEFVLREQ